jgi:hypothetical protein
MGVLHCADALYPLRYIHDKPTTLKQNSLPPRLYAK